MKLQFSTVLLACIIILTCSCRHNSSDIPANVVNNPLTADGKGNTDELPAITFEKDFHDFGRLHTGEKVTYSFRFRNTGKSLLLISNVSTSCGCTVSNFSKQPVKPGEESTIDVSFDSEGRRGLQNKTISVFTNTQPPTTILRIQALVVELDNK
jgi:hypothetical protein